MFTFNPLRKLWGGFPGFVAIIVILIALLAGCPMPEPTPDSEPMTEPEPMPEPEPMTEATPPSTMDAPAITVGHTQLTATWSPPNNDGGSEITAYHVQHKISAAEWPEDDTTDTAIISDTTITSHPITGLINGNVYDVRVRAVNMQGNGVWSEHASAMLPIPVTQTPAGTAATVSLSAAARAIIADESPTVTLTIVEQGTLAVSASGVSITPATTPAGLTVPTVDSGTGMVTVAADTTAGTYLVYGETGTGDILFAEYFFVTVSPQDKTELQAIVTAAIGNINDANDSGIWGDTANLNYIITTAVTDMSNMFQSASAFNGDISGWDVSAVTTMRSMFFQASTFNSDITGWDVSAVTDIAWMFYQASAFNRDLEEWKDHWTLSDNKYTLGKYTGAKGGMFLFSGVVTNTDGSDMSKPTGVGAPSWY